MTKTIVVRKKDVTVAESDAWLTPYNPNVGKVWSADDYYFIEAKDGFKTDVPFIDLQMVFAMMIPPAITIINEMDVSGEGLKAACSESAFASIITDHIRKNRETIKRILK